MEGIREQIQAARRANASGGETVLDALLRASSGARSDLDAALRLHAGVAAVFEAADGVVEFDALGLERARSLRCVPVRLHGEKTTRVAMGDPWDRDRVREIGLAMGQVPGLAAAPGALLDRWLNDSGDSPLRVAQRSLADTATGPVVAFVDTALRAAFDGGASDVHFECDRGGLTARLRVDGVMVRHSRIESVERAEEVVSRVKVLAQLDITERRTPQDGRFRLELGASGSIDLRVSIMPSVFGEDAVLRLLDKAQLRERHGAITLDMLGFAEEGASRLRELAELPHGMLMITGPTGSGKTTTVYALLSEVNSGLEKIVTIEDPVEYELPGVLQIPVNERKGLTFAKGLRSILRHDPDRILVGEIRDGETAEIAVQSALTGHQVFTTIHANSLFDVTGRFRHFGLDMFGFMSSLNGVVVQRLVRTLCTHCASSRQASARESVWLASTGVDSKTVPVAVGCEQCRHSGYRGRRVLAEVHRIDDGFRDLVIRSSPVSELRAHVAQAGVQTLSSLAGNLVASGHTTPEEIKRVVGW